VLGIRLGLGCVPVLYQLIVREALSRVAAFLRVVAVEGVVSLSVHQEVTCRLQCNRHIAESGLIVFKMVRVWLLI
jgi:hypothetical protein